MLSEGKWKSKELSPAKMECAGKGQGTRCTGPPRRRCGRCGAVSYCSIAHQLCQKQESRCSFLTKRGIHRVGMWFYECPCGGLDASFSFLRLNDSWVLQKILCPCSEPLYPITNHLRSWKDYYDWRCIPLNSPVSLLLHWPLTISYAMQIVGFGPLNPEFGDSLCIHYLGPEKELMQLSIFAELHALFPGVTLRIELVGPAIPEEMDGKTIDLCGYPKCLQMDCNCKSSSENVNVNGDEHSNKQSLLTLKLWKGYYHDCYKGISKDYYPHLIVAPNAGIAAYSSWLPTIELIKEINVPAIFSDLCEEACHLGATCLSSVIGRPITFPIQLNPFRQPMAMEDTALFLPCYSNCFLYGF